MLPCRLIEPCLLGTLNPLTGVVARWMRSGGGGEVGLAGGMSCELVEDFARRSGMKEGGGMVFAGGGCLGGGGSIITGGLDLSAGGEPDRVRVRVDSGVAARAASMDGLRSCVDERGVRGMAGNDGAVVITVGTIALVDPGEVGGDTNWNCWPAPEPTRLRAKPAGGAGVHSSVCTEVSFTSGFGTCGCSCCSSSTFSVSTSAVE